MLQLPQWLRNILVNSTSDLVTYLQQPHWLKISHYLSGFEKYTRISHRLTKTFSSLKSIEKCIHVRILNSLQRLRNIFSNQLFQWPEKTVQSNVTNICTHNNKKANNSCAHSAQYSTVQLLNEYQIN